MAKVIFHIDINSFYASAHSIENSSLIGKPVAVCSNNRGSVITTASYEARAFGVTSAMPLVQAKRLCDSLIVVDIDFPLYQELSQKFMSIIRRYSTILQQASIDECYVDMTEKIKEYKRPLDLAAEIQKVVWNELKLPISIGVAPNKFLAKMASDYKKPNGITVFRIREIDKYLWPMPIGEMHGIGIKTLPKLVEKKVTTIGHLAQAKPDDLRSILGNQTDSFIQKANGVDESIIDLDTTRKSVGQSKTYRTPLVESDEIRLAILEETEDVGRRIRSQNMVSKTIQFSVRLESYLTAARSITLDSYTDETSVIYEKVINMYDEFEELGNVTFISVTCANLVSKEDIVEQLNIFDDLETPTTNDIISRLNQELNGNIFKTPRDLLNSGLNHE